MDILETIRRRSSLKLFNGYSDSSINTKAENDPKEQKLKTVTKKIAYPPPSPKCSESTPMLPQVPQVTITNAESQRRGSETGSYHSSRRPSLIIAALRRPSQAIALSAAQAVMHQRRFIMGLFNGYSDSSINTKAENDQKEQNLKTVNKKIGYDYLSIILSALYAKVLVVLGIAFPVTQIVSREIGPFFYQGFYLYLYLGCILFITFMYGSLVRDKIIQENLLPSDEKKPDVKTKPPKVAPKYGSFYLRLGAISFGIGSMVYSGLEFGKYFELKNNPLCQSGVIQAITPAVRMMLTLMQVQFLFLNTKDVEFSRRKLVSRFGLMHMLATNLCEWLYVLVEETKHEIIHLSEHESHSNDSIYTILRDKSCPEGSVMGQLVSNASPFLFPCKIEYSLICAVILFEIWKKVKMEDDEEGKRLEKLNEKNANACQNFNKVDRLVSSNFQFNPFGGRVVTSDNHFTLDCSNAHRGLFAGIVIVVFTIISLIMFFVLSNSSKLPSSQKIALFEVAVLELTLYLISTIAIIIAMWKMRGLKYDKKVGQQNPGLGLDTTLLVVAQTGMYIYCMFSLIACSSSDRVVGVIAEVFSFIQTSLQTMFVLDGWWRRCRNITQTKSKPGREIITFLIVANMALWMINALEKNRAEFKPSLLKFYGAWAWTIITHVSMPLAIFYRFHSTICLFEIWKSAYKIKTNYKSPLFPMPLN